MYNEYYPSVAFSCQRHYCTTLTTNSRKRIGVYGLLIIGLNGMYAFVTSIQSANGKYAQYVPYIELLGLTISATLCYIGD